MDLVKKSRIKSYIYDGIVIFVGVFLSFFVEDLRIQNLNDHRKNQYLKDLRLTLDDDVNQINHLKEVLNKSVSYINQIQDDIDQNHSLMNDTITISKLIDIEVGISFFSKDGIYNQLIATDAFELIKSTELKNILLEMYNHLKERNIATSNEIDQFNIGFRRTILENFRVRFNYDLLDGEFYGNRSVKVFEFNKSCYESNDFYGILSQAKLYSNMYQRQLKDLHDIYIEAIQLVNKELKISS